MCLNRKRVGVFFFSGVAVFLRGRKIWGKKSGTVYMLEDYNKKNSQFAMLTANRTMNAISRSPKRKRLSYLFRNKLSRRWGKERR